MPIDAYPRQPKVIRPPDPAVDQATPGSGLSGSGGTAILVVPTLGLLGMVAAVVVVNDVNHWWALVPAILLALVATASVLATVMRMLDGDD